ncbi:MAG: 30S ribosomal protein S20 [Spirochaetia bacterium]|nr:30S ribosomal protein S20 [Spirochaetia bacterium]
MPNLKASIKDLRKTAKRTERRKGTMSAVKNAVKKIRKATPEEAAKQLPSLYKLVDKAVQSGMMKKNTAARYKSNATAYAKSGK